MIEAGDEARRTAAHAARASFGRLVSLLAAANGDIAGAEDAVGGALEQALRTWPSAGVPANPEGWLLTVARNRQRDVWKSAANRTRSDRDLGEVPVPLDDLDPEDIGDRRLGLMFACAHPAIDPAVRTLLMLQAVLGFTTADIAAAYGQTPAAVAKRLVRAKHRIRETGIPFSIPDRPAAPARMQAVLEAVYGCFAIAWHDADGRSHQEPDSMAGEALYLAEILAELLEAEAEAWSLAALIAFSLSRAAARSGPFIPLEEQDPQRWDQGLIRTGEAYLRRAGMLGGPPGRFQLEAAMQAVHSARVHGAGVDWAALKTLAQALVVVAPSLGSRIALAAIIGRVDGAEAGLLILDALPPEAGRLAAFHATRGDLLARCGRIEEASQAFTLAAEREKDPAAARHLRLRSRG